MSPKVVKKYGKFRGVTALAIGLAFVFGLAPASWGASLGLPDGQEVTTPKILAACDVVPDQQLREMRGRFATYYFGLDVGLDLSGPKPGMTVNYHASVPDGSATPKFTGNTASFNNGNVNFQAGIGNTSLGSGIFNVVQVAGNNNLVVSTMNININAGSLPLVASLTGLSTPGSLAGIRH